LSTTHEIRRWLEGTKGRPLPTGRTVEEAIEAGRVLLNKLEDRSTGHFLANDPDVLFGLWRCLEADGASSLVVASAYAFVSSCSWVRDEFDEREQLLASLSLLAWSNCRHRAAFDEMNEWEKRCLAHVSAQQPVRDFLALPFESRTLNINERFLNDRTVLLGVCEVLHDLRNRRPLIGAREGGLIYEWILSDRDRPMDEELQYFAGDVALSVAGASRQLGLFRLHEQWLGRAQMHFEKTVTPEALLARLEWSRLAAHHSLNRPEKAVAGLPAVRNVFRKYGLAEDQLKCDFVEATVLKAMGRQEESLKLFDAIIQSEWLDRSPLIAALSLISIGELHAQLGNPERGFQFLAESQRHVREADSPMAYGGIHAVSAEILKNEGELSKSIEEYGKAIEIYRNAGMSGQETYTRLLRADVLLAASRDDEAIQDLLCSLPVIESEDRGLEKWAATALLRESLRRKHIDAATVEQFRRWHSASREQ
jgi:tetratricopeptide (TPR) repeat protein